MWEKLDIGLRELIFFKVFKDFFFESFVLKRSKNEIYDNNEK